MSNTKIILGNELVNISDEILKNFKKGDKLIALSATKQILHIPAEEFLTVEKAVSCALLAFEEMNQISDKQITTFYEIFAKKLSDLEISAEIFQANKKDVLTAKKNGRSTTRLELKKKYLEEMIVGLNFWKNMDPIRGKVLRKVKDDGFIVEEILSSYGVIGFIFEGRPNVFIDACGVLKSGNTCVFRIGSSALNTAKAIMSLALKPALKKSGLPENAVTLIDSKAHSAAWALFSDKRLGLAVARGSGKTVQMLGEIAKQNGIETSLHGTGGAWMIIDEQVDLKKLSFCIFNSLDRKVCNTLNTICILKKNAEKIVPKIIETLKKKSLDFGYNFKIHATKKAKPFLSSEILNVKVKIFTKEGVKEDFLFSEISNSDLGIEWEWEKTPEITLHIIDNLEEGIKLFNQQSSKFVVSLISENKKNQEIFFNLINSPFVGDGFTRWVDGQYLFKTPELGLSNWEYGRLFGRAGVLSGGDIFSVKVKMRQGDINLKR